MSDRTIWKITWQNRMLKCYKKKNGAFGYFLEKQYMELVFSFIFCFGVFFLFQDLGDPLLSRFCIVYFFLFSNFDLLNNY